MSRRRPGRWAAALFRGGDWEGHGPSAVHEPLLRSIRKLSANEANQCARSQSMRSERRYLLSVASGSNLTLGARA